MAKKIKTLIKLNIPAGSATPAPPVGPALGQHGLPIMEFVKAFNDKTADQKGNILPVVITVYEDRTFSFITKKPPVAEMIKKPSVAAAHKNRAKNRQARSLRLKLNRLLKTKWKILIQLMSRWPVVLSRVLHAAWVWRCLDRFTQI